MAQIHHDPNTIEPYNANPELVKMREDIANREYNLTVKSLLITGAMAVAGAAIAALTLPALPFFVGMEAFAMVFSAIAGGMAGTMAGGITAGMATMKERKQLQIDEEMLNGYMGGKNYWGEGYRKEVAEYGYAGPQVAAAQGASHVARLAEKAHDASHHMQQK